MDLVPLAAHSRGYSLSLRPFFWRAWQLVAFSPTGLCGERGNHEPPDTHVPCSHFSGGRGTWWRFHLHPGTRVPCGNFSGGRRSWWRFHLLVHAAKEDTLNIRKASRTRVGCRVSVPEGSYSRELLNSDALEYGGTGVGNLGGVNAPEVFCPRPIYPALSIPR
jgi:hypothetical protein